MAVMLVDDHFFRSHASEKSLIEGIRRLLLV